MKKLRFILAAFALLIICDWVFFLLFIVFNAALATTVEEKVPTKDELILSLEEKFEAIDTYSCIMRIEVYSDNDKTQYQNHKFIFKKPGMIYCEQLGPYKEGIVVTVDKNERIQAYKKGFWGMLWRYIRGKKILERGDEELKGITGETIFQIDWGYIIGEMKRLKDEVDSYQIESQTIDDQEVYVFDLTRGQEEFLFHIDKKLMVIVKLERFFNGKMTDKVVWEEIEINTEVKDEFFD